MSFPTDLTHCIATHTDGHNWYCNTRCSWFKSSDWIRHFCHSCCRIL